MQKLLKVETKNSLELVLSADR